jgi:cation diffusion facilitator CzcD-associated flavoprotein CzcO
VGVVKALGPNRRLSVIHGNHLTAAAVVQTISQCFGDRKVKLFLTGASSKVGWAVAQALRDRHGYDVLCHSTDPGRRKYFEKNGFAAASTLAEGSAHSHFWIVGKYDVNVCKWIPQHAVAIVFSVPHPLETRQDLRIIEAGTLHMDLSRLDKPRVFTNKLKANEIFACHAASVVAVSRLEQRKVLRIDEVGPVDPNEMDSWLDDAKRIGFVVPQYHSVFEVDPRNLGDKPPVVIVGGGPSGLSVAAYLSQKRIPHILLEAENDPNVFGSWARHFKGLEITTQKKWCNLPGLSMSDKEFPNETVTAEEYQRYLKQYVHRFSINICRGATVISVEKGTETNPYLVKYHVQNGSVTTRAAWSVVVATGKHRIPRISTGDDIVSKLNTFGIPHCHSTEMCDDESWSRAIQAAQVGRLCLIGFGNSAADLATMILQRCKSDDSASGVKTTIHVAARTIPPVFPRRYKLLRVDTLGYIMRFLPEFFQDILVKLLWAGIPGSKTCQSAFPSHLKRWNKIEGRVPVIDKHGMLANGFQSGRLVGHGPISNVTKGRMVHFSDGPSLQSVEAEIDMVILATGYQEECIVEREDRLNGLYKCGFSNSDRFLPLLSISEDAKGIVDDIAVSYCN